MGGESLRIAFLNSWPTASHEGSGTAVAIHQLGEGLRRLGHQVETLTPHGGASISLEARVCFNLVLDRWLAESGPFDLVVGFDMDGFATDRSVLPPFVLCVKGVAADEARFAGGSEGRALQARARLERHNALKSHRVVVPSRYSAEVVRRLYRVPPARIQVVPEAVDPGPWDRLRQNPPLRPQRPTILSVARQYRRKDTCSLLRAVALLRTQIPDLHLRVIGGGPELPRLRRLAGELELQAHVTFEGPVPDDATVRNAYLQAHVFCLPSLQEGFGIVFVEAMAAGLPVVAVRAGAVPEVVPHGRVGTLTAPGDPEALSQALLELLQDPELRRQFGEAGRRRARSFTPSVVARRFLAATLPGPAPAGLRRAPVQPGPFPTQERPA